MIVVRFLFGVMVGVMRLLLFLFQLLQEIVIGLVMVAVKVSLIILTINVLINVKPIPLSVLTMVEHGRILVPRLVPAFLARIATRSVSVRSPAVCGTRTDTVYPLARHASVVTP